MKFKIYIFLYSQCFNVATDFFLSSIVAILFFICVEEPFKNIGISLSQKLFPLKEDDEKPQIDVWHIGSSNHTYV